MAKFFPALAFSIVWVYASQQINSSQYGLFQKIWSQLFVFVAIGTIGFPVLVLTYSASKAAAILHLLKAKGIGLYGLFVLLLAILFGLLQQHNQANLFLLSALFFIVFVAIVLADALLIVFKSFKAIIALNFVYALLFCAIHFWNISQGFELSQLLFQLILLCLARLLACMLFIVPQYKIHLATATIIETTDWSKIKKLWLQLGINDIINVLFRWIDKFILSLLLSKEWFAIYFNGTIEIPFLPILFSAVSSAAVQHWANHHIARAGASKIPLLHYSARILSSIIFPLFFFFIFFRVAFLSVIFSPQYVSAVWIFVCTQLVLPVRAYPFTAILQSEHRGDIVNKGAVIDFILACVLMYPLYLLMGLPGVALSFVLSTYWQAGYYLLQTSKIIQQPISVLIPFKLLLRKLLVYALVFALSFYAAQSIFHSNMAQFICGTAVLLILIVFSLWLDWNKNQVAINNPNHE
ncbi:MAG: hypothetical protein QM530_08480 [Phycisphaerales bacterium]|nr:hypothetical protein [Phycisphaerales bacterium]